MGSRTRVYWLHALTPLHVGSGRSTDSFVDLPVAREKATGRPVVPGSAVKGVLRDHFEASLEQHLLDQAFGRPDDGNSPAQAGALVLSDARLVLLPVRSLYGTFAYLSSPLTLKRLARDLQEAQCES
ncbi:MAG: type III-B CRISPR module RAMP protein Cmr4, partial [Clostridia bacterium]|nr:type III-B CRISPR module RAMP protein Cmr4 [Clostridia bacterium]